MEEHSRRQHSLKKGQSFQSEFTPPWDEERGFLWEREFLHESEGIEAGSLH